METSLLKRLDIKRLIVPLPYLAWVAISLYIVRHAWVAEDAYITFRVIDNFLHGYGLRWNVYERVQVYTHPLWLLMQIPVAAAFGNPFLANILLSIGCSVSALYLVFTGTPRPARCALILFFLPLFLSKSFIDYSASGLENPLSFLLFAVFGHVLLNCRHDPRFWLWLSLSVSLAIVNRMDTALIYLPTLIYLFMQQRRHIRWQQVALGFLPLFYWLIFSLWYYGFIFPNTKYAKLNTGISLLLYFQQGLQYVKYLLIYDLQALLILLAAIALLITKVANRLVPAKNGLPRALAAGVACYVFYTISIGGDYMAGRFWAVPVFVSIWIFYAFIPMKRGDALFLTVCILCAPLFITPSLQNIRQNCPPCLKVDEKIIDAAFVFSDNRFIGRLNPLYIQTEGSYTFGDDGKKLAAKTMIEEDTVQNLYNIGMSGYYAGPKAQIIDELALADPLLARLPVPKTERFYVSHYRRKIPSGYKKAIKTGSLDAMDSSLSEYYEKLRLMTSGDLLDGQRMKTILLFNLGYYDHLRDDYVKRNTP